MPDALALQRGLAALILDPEPGGEGLGPCREGLLAYRDLVRSGLEDPLEAVFPVTRALLEEGEAWRPCVDAFLASRSVASRHYRDIAPTFLGWLAETSFGRDRWPFLLELAHFELLETLVERFEDLEPEGPLLPDPAPGLRVVPDPAAQLVAYTHAVHRATEDAPWPEAVPAHLLAYRDREGAFSLLELTPATAALLHRAAAAPLGEVLAALGAEAGPELLALLGDLRRRGAIAGFRGKLAGE